MKNFSLLFFLTFDEIVLNKRVYFKFILLILTNDSSNFKPIFFNLDKY